MAQGVKTIDKDKFFEAFYGFMNEHWSLTKASKVAGISVPTMKKYFNAVLLGEELPDTLFENKLDIMKRKAAEQNG